MFEMPAAEPTWSAGTAAVEPDDAGPFASPRPTREHEQRADERGVRPGRVDERERGEAERRQREAERHRPAAADLAGQRRDRAA